MFQNAGIAMPHGKKSPLRFEPDAGEIMYDDRALHGETIQYANDVEKAKAELVAVKLEQTRHAFFLQVAAAVNEISAIDMANNWLEQVQKKPVIAVVQHAIGKCLRKFKERIGYLFHFTETRVEQWRLDDQDPSKPTWKVSLMDVVSQEFDAFKDEVLKLQDDFELSEARFVSKNSSYFSHICVSGARNRLAHAERNKKQKTGDGGCAAP